MTTSKNAMITVHLAPFSSIQTNTNTNDIKAIHPKTTVSTILNVFLNSFRILDADVGGPLTSIDNELRVLAGALVLFLVGRQA